MGLVLLAAASAHAQNRQIAVRVEDPSGATIPQARTHRARDSACSPSWRPTGGAWRTINVRRARRVRLVVSAPGFATTELDVAIAERPCPQPVTVSLPLANIETDVSVSATETEAGGSTETLSQAEIDQLPDDPDELQRMLEEIAGPGAAIRVDGFTGGRLPTRDQIARIVVRRDAFSAEFHQIGQGRVEIATRPGVDRWRGNAGLNAAAERAVGAQRGRAKRQGGHAGANERVRRRAAGEEPDVVLGRARGLVLGGHARHRRRHAAAGRSSPH